MKNSPAAQSVLVVLFLLILGSLYLYPGLQPLFSGKTDIVMSDGTDPVTLPFMYEQVLRVAKDSPTDLFFWSRPQPRF